MISGTFDAVFLEKSKKLGITQVRNAVAVAYRFTNGQPSAKTLNRSVLIRCISFIPLRANLFRMGTGEGVFQWLPILARTPPSPYAAVH